MSLSEQINGDDDDDVTQKNSKPMSNNS